MSEQQRVFLAITACLAIFLGWQWFVAKDVESKRPKNHLAAEKAEVPEIANSDTPATVGSEPAKGGSPEGQTAAVIDSANQLPPEVSEVHRDFSTPLFHGQVSSIGPSLTSLELNNFSERGEGQAAGTKPVSLVTAEQALAANADRRQASVNWQIGGQQVRAFVPVEGKQLAFSAVAGEGVQAYVEFLPRSDVYAIDYVLRVHNQSLQPVQVGASVHLALTPQVKQKSSFFVPPADQLHTVCAAQEKVERHLAKELATPTTFEMPAKWAALDRQYFVVALLGQGALQGQCVASAKGETVAVDYGIASESVAAGAVWEKRVTLYVGPKRDADLKAVSPLFLDTIDYNLWHIPLGFLARPMVAVLNVFHQWTASWGIAIVMLTFLVRLMLLPVTYKSVVSMRKMQLLKPEMDRLKKQFENDRERQQMEQLKLFREKGVNPLGGCLPMLLQMPVFFALYRMLWSAVDLYQQPFLWLPDLTAKEPLPFMAVALGVFTLLQQKLTPMGADSQQARMMMYIMPAVMVVFMIGLPSGLVLYFLVSNILTIIQQVAINSRPVTL